MNHPAQAQAKRQVQPSTPKRLVDLNVAAAYASCCRETIRRRIADGTLHGYCLGKRLLRVDLNEVDAALTPVLSDWEWLRSAQS